MIKKVQKEKPSSGEEKTFSYIYSERIINIVADTGPVSPTHKLS